MMLATTLILALKREMKKIFWIGVNLFLERYFTLKDASTVPQYEFKKFLRT